MPSKNPRMVLTLKPDTHGAIVKTAKAAGVFPSYLVASMLDDMVPMLNHLYDATVAAKEKKAEAYEHLASSVGDAQIAAAQLQMDFSRAAKVAATQKTKRKKSHA